jgi:uncharacterized protein YjbJ (UPF0337 family)
MSPNKTQLQAQWGDMRGRVKESWGALTDNDLLRSEGNWDQLVATIRSKTGDSLDTVEDTLNDLLDKVNKAGK